VNNWCAEEGIPSLLDKDALKKTQLVTTDNDPYLYGSFQAVFKRYESLYGTEAKDWSCKWHKVSYYLQYLITLFCILLNQRCIKGQSKLYFKNSWNDKQ